MLYVEVQRLYTAWEGGTTKLGVYSNDHDPQAVVDAANAAYTARETQFAPWYELDERNSGRDVEHWCVTNLFPQIESGWRFLVGFRFNEVSQSLDNTDWIRFVLLIFRTPDGSIKMLVGVTTTYNMYLDIEPEPGQRGSEECLVANSVVTTHHTLDAEDIRQIARDQAPSTAEDLLLDLSEILMAQLEK